MQQDGTVRAIFFDFGGVIVRMGREIRAGIEARQGLPKGGFMRAITELPEWKAAEVGKGTEEAFLEAMKRKLDGMGVKLPFDIEDAWSMMWRTLDADILRLIELLGARYDVGVLSNATLRLDDELREQKIDGLFKVIVNSSRVGMGKPDARIYHLAAEWMGVEPSACVHIDDDEHNVQAARDAGFYGIHHQGDCAVLERELRSLGLEW